MKNIDELKAERLAAEKMVKMFADITKDKKIICVSNYLDFSRKLEGLTMGNENLTDKQAEDLTNIIKQFSKIIDDYIKEKR